MIEKRTTHATLEHGSQLTHAQELVAYLDELGIEAWLLEIHSNLLAKRGSFEVALGTDLKAALRQIDDLKASFAYDAERQRLKAIAGRKPSWIRMHHQLAVEHGMFLDRIGMTNLLIGLQSPDLDQRARFQQFWDKEGIAKLKDDELEGRSHVFCLLEKAKKPKGAPTVSPPWRNYHNDLDRMRIMVGRHGLTPPEAAKAIASEQSRARPESRANYLRNFYERRMALRE